MELHCMYSFVSHFFCSVLCIQFICVAADSCDSFICIIIFHCIGEGNGTPLQCSCLENPMDGGSWWATVHGVAKSWTRLSDFTFIFTFLHWRRKWQPTPVFLLGKSHGWRSLVGYSGLQSMDGGAWWATVHGVAKSRTRLSDFTFTFILI